MFAAALAGAATPAELEVALTQMQTSQHQLVEQLTALEQHHPGQLHAATDITGFGLLGHLGEMVGDTTKHPELLQIQLDANRIPALPGVLALLAAGHSSSLAPANRRAWSLLDSKDSDTQPAAVLLHIDEYRTSSQDRQALLEPSLIPKPVGRC